MGTNVKESLMQDCTVPAQYKIPSRKVTVVGAGQVGMACAYSIMQQVTTTYVKLCSVCLLACARARARSCVCCVCLYIYLVFIYV